MTSERSLESDDSNIVLAGFMGTGKSTVGRALAEKINRTFVDTDAMIEADHGPIAAIFANDGEAAFRALEAQAALSLSGRCRMVIATGGGLFLNPANAEALLRTGRVFCLHAPVTEVIRRIEADLGAASRPLLQEPDPLVRATALYAKRQSIYMQFEQVDTEQRSVDDIVDDIISRLA